MPLRSLKTVFALALCLLWCRSGGAAERLDRQAMRLVFAEDFHSLSLRLPSNPNGRWDTKFQFGGRSLPTNGELEFYADPDYLGLGLNPFSVDADGLTITARAADAALQPKLGGLRYVSGLLTSEHSFAQTYGYFELRARLPAGQGLWPAFWLLPLSKEWPPEIDVFEMLGDEPGLVYMSIHSKILRSTGSPVRVPDSSKDFHDYGVLWGHDQITWYFDGVERARLPTPADMHQPMYLLINLAVGGTWPGVPDRSTRFPAEMKVAFVKAYATTETIPALPTNRGE